MTKNYLKPPAGISKPILTLDIKMVKCKVIEIIGDRDSCYECGRSNYTTDISDWNLVSEEEYSILCKFISYPMYNDDKTYIICKQVDDLVPVFKRVMKHAKASVEKKERREKNRKANTEKRAKTKEANQKKKELKLLAELKAKHE